MQSIRELTALSLAAAGIFFIAPATASTLMQKDSTVINTLFSQTNEYTNKKGDRFMREKKHHYPVYIKDKF